MNEKDRGVVEGMIAAGMSLEALYKIFKNFAREDIKKVYAEYQKSKGDYVEEPINISMNCS